MKKITIAGREISEKYPPYIIAEISANHNGSIDKAKETILHAKKSGASAVKIQTYTPDTMTIEKSDGDFLINEGLWKGYSLYNLYRKAFTPFEWHEDLFKFAKSKNITLFSSPFDESAVDLLESLNVPAYKIASFELIDLPLISYIAKKKKPILMSTGMSSIDEISQAIKVAKDNGNDQIALFHCISSYPTPIDQANIRTINKLQRIFKVQVGLSDHTLGTLAPIVATSCGATLIEKHFTINKSDKGPDSSFSINPKEMEKLVSDCNLTFKSLGKELIERVENEESNKIFRRSLYFVNDLSPNQKIQAKDIRRIRPGFGLPPKFYSEVIGRKVKKHIKRGDRVSWDVIK